MSAVGFIGLGTIGTPMAKRLLDRPEGPASLVVHDLRPEALDRFVRRGATAATSPAEVARRADFISIMVATDVQVEAVLTDILTTAKPGTIVAIHSTVADTTVVGLNGRAAAHGVEVVDAAVSGGPMGAAEGTLAVMVGASEPAFERCREVFAAWASLIVHCGGPGGGTRAKLARNLLHFVAFSAAVEASRLAEAAGLDLVELGTIVRHTDAVTGGPGAIMHRDTAAPVAPDDGWHSILTHVRDLGEKDLGLALGLGERLGVDLPLAALAREHLADYLGVPHD